MSNESKMQLALEDLRNQQFSSVRKAADFHDVPRSILQDRVNGKPTR